MGDKNSTHAQIERLIEMANELEERELALNQETEHLEQMRTSLDERERKLSAAAAEAEELAKTKGLAKSAGDAPQVERPLAEKQAEKPAEKPTVSAANKAETTRNTVLEINDILKSIFQDYSSSVHQISAQMSTVTAAMMCAAVTCVLENQGFDAKAVVYGGNGKIAPKRRAERGMCLAVHVFTVCGQTAADRCGDKRRT